MTIRSAIIKERRDPTDVSGAGDQLGNKSTVVRGLTSKNRTVSSTAKDDERSRTNRSCMNRGKGWSRQKEPTVDSFTKFT